MRLINAGGFSTDERKQWRTVIFNNLSQAFQIILRAMDEQDVTLNDPANEVGQFCAEVVGTIRLKKNTAICSHHTPRQRNHCLTSFPA